LLTFWLAPDSGEKLTLDVTILLSLVFYLQIISEYIPRGFSKIPILTLFTLTNFSIVFLSCAMSVIVLRLYYRTPSFLAPKHYQLPYILRLVLFKYIAPFLCLKFYFRQKDEFYPVSEKDSNDEAIQQANSQFDLLKCFKNIRVISNPNEESVEKNTRELYVTLKLLNNHFSKTNGRKSHQYDDQNKGTKMISSQYYEEWKQASLVLDR
jgi:hypothetical protein